MAPKTTHVAVAAVVTFVAFATWLFGGWSQGDTVQVVDDVALGVLVIPAVVFATRAARSAHGRTRAAWVALIVGLCGWFAGEAIWAYYELILNQAPFPSLADAGFLALPVGACVALLLFPDDYNRYSVGRAFLDGVIVAGSLFLVSWVTVLGPLYEAGAKDRLGFVVSLAYPVFDVVILTVAAIVLMRAQTHQRLVLMLLTVGLACIAVADSGFVYLQNTGRYASGNTIDIGWAAGFLLITVAGAAGRVDEHRNASPQLPSWASAWLPYAPLLLAGLVAAAEPPRVLKSGPVVVVAAMLVLAVLIRQLLAISENRRLLEQVADQARRDPLTGLANRTLLYERLEHAMKLRERDVLCVGVLSLDLDDFKRVNDTFGHHAGDELLIEVADRLTGGVRSGDTVARLGGDEFIVLIEDSADQSYLVANRILSAFDEPMRIDGHEVSVLPSVGLAVAGADEPDLSVAELLRRADAAMYASKSAGTRGVQPFTPQMLLPGKDIDALGRMPNRAADAHGAAELKLLGELRQSRGELSAGN